MGWRVCPLQTQCKVPLRRFNLSCSQCTASHAHPIHPPSSHFWKYSMRCNFARQVDVLAGSTMATLILRYRNCGEVGAHFFTHIAAFAARKKPTLPSCQTAFSQRASDGPSDGWTAPRNEGREGVREGASKRVSALRASGAQGVPQVRLSARAHLWVMGLGQGCVIRLLRTS